MATCDRISDYTFADDNSWLAGQYALSYFQLQVCFKEVSILFGKTVLIRYMQLVLKI